jgi:hypothetical protein
MHADVSAATLYPQTTILVALTGAALVEGEFVSGSISPLTMAV